MKMETSFTDLKNFRLDEMRRRLNHLTKHLLEEETPGMIGTTDDAYRDFGGRVVFMHRTVYDFFRLPDVSKDLADWRESAFDVHSVVAEAVQAQLKTADRHASYFAAGNAEVDRMIETFFYHIEILQNQGPLNTSCIELIGEFNVTTSRQHKQRAMAEGLRGWYSIASGRLTYKPGDMRAVTIRLGLYSYLDSQVLQVPSNPNISLLSQFLRFISTEAMKTPHTLRMSRVVSVANEQGFEKRDI
jgi:hypothetical protein